MKPIFSPDGSYTEQYKNMCWKKFWYETELEARRYAVNQMAQMRVNKPVFRAYKCDYCSGWHLTSHDPDIKLWKKGSFKLCKKPHMTQAAADQGAKALGSSWFACTRCGNYHVEK